MSRYPSAAELHVQTMTVYNSSLEVGELEEEEDRIRSFLIKQGGASSALEMEMERNLEKLIKRKKAQIERKMKALRSIEEALAGIGQLGPSDTESLDMKEERPGQCMSEVGEEELPRGSARLEDRGLKSIKGHLASIKNKFSKLNK